MDIPNEFIQDLSWDIFTNNWWDEWVNQHKLVRLISQGNYVQANLHK